MGYNTDFKGEFKFTKELTASQLAHLMTAILGQDRRDHPEWDLPVDCEFYYVNLETLPDLSGIKWNHSEKTYGMAQALNLVITEMRKKWPDFGLQGKMLAQGEEIDDRYELIVNEEGFISKVPVIVTGQKIQCPHCEEHFYIEEGSDQK